MEHFQSQFQVSIVRFESRSAGMEALACFFWTEWVREEEGRVVNLKWSKGLWLFLVRAFGRIMTQPDVGKSSQMQTCGRNDCQLPLPVHIGSPRVFAKLHWCVLKLKCCCGQVAGKMAPVLTVLGSAIDYSIGGLSWHVLREWKSHFAAYPIRRRSTHLSSDQPQQTHPRMQFGLEISAKFTNVFVFSNDLRWDRNPDVQNIRRKSEEFPSWRLLL